ncbi:hypothetical protein IL992_43945 [Microbispora sp. NEAU-D428]|uniref:methyltransferase domain-containing protein n=1 Tax=Microbispora sitophila TaxID=2771537 RepID=UPI001867AB22|nr:methyltransferase [Microbispora sitophila]MBE3016057.1 hypothetical protein [Microbispora sitophila]
MSKFGSPVGWERLDFGASAIASQITASADNPWLTFGIMNGIKEEELLREWDNVLDVQTRILGEREVAWLRANGFGADGAGVLEVGGANGMYGSFLAGAFPDSRLFGLEANRHIAERCRTDVLNYSMDVCKVGQEDLPARVHGAFSQCILRFTLQHVSDPLKVLSTLYESLPPGGRVFIIEEDLGYWTMHPDWRPFGVFVDALRRLYATGGSDSEMGSKLPRLVSAAGFRIDAFDISLRNNAEMGESFLDLLGSIIRMFGKTDPEVVSEADVAAVIDGFADARDDHHERFLATYPQFLLAATKPGA